MVRPSRGAHRAGDSTTAGARQTPSRSRVPELVATATARKFRYAIGFLCLVVVAAQWFAILHSHGGRGGDYSLSREFGRRFLYHEDLYGHGLHYPYMPSAAMYFAPLALVSFTTGILLRYCAALVCLWLSLRMTQTMTRASNPQMEGSGFQISVLTIVLASHYVLRDLDDGGPHLILLAMLVTGVFNAWKGNERFAAGCFGLASALKAN